MKLPSLVCLVDHQGRVIKTNPAVSRWRDAVNIASGETPHGLLHSGCTSDSCVFHRKWRQLWGAMQTVRRQTCDLTDPFLRRRLRLSTERIDIPPDESSPVTGQYGIVRISDIGLSRRRAPRSSDSRSAGNGYASDREIAAAVERERHRIAAELHDGISQQLALMKLQIESRLAHGLSGNGASSAEDLLLQVVEGLKGTLGEIRQLNGSLMSERNDRAGLVARLRELCDCADRVRPGTRVTFESPLTDMDFLSARCGEYLPLAVYRISQEAIGNALKHADARTVKVRLLPSSGSQPFGELTLSIQDDGRGFDASREKRDCTASGLGLTTMRQRALETGGEPSVRSRPNEGTEVRVSWSMVLGAT